MPIHVVIKNSQTVVARAKTLPEAKTIVDGLLADSPSASYEIGKLSKRIYNETVPPTHTPIEEEL